MAGKAEGMVTSTGIEQYGAEGALAQPQVVPRSKGRVVINWITSTDHKTIGYLYLITSFTLFCLGGVMALLIRAELFEPGMQILQTKEQYNNQLFSMHGTLMLLLFATPAFRRFRQRDRATADRRTGCSIPQAECPGVLVLSVRLAHRCCWLPHPAGRGVAWLDRLRPVVKHHVLSRSGW
jgi:hypothetical protein